ncbi:MAG: GDSL-type esterase/lipase family protein [Verrucomicrobia bacterium]|nr:GDSL-type esterase/lipase family protein [Verrucomicrobiota bacterium]
MDRFLILLLVAGQHLPGMVAHATASNRFESEIAAFERLDQQDPPASSPILFTGSSSIRQWADLERLFQHTGYATLNRGFGGSMMSDVNECFHRIVQPYRPSLVVVYEGDNDLASGMSPQDVMKEFYTFSRLLMEHLPNTDLAVMSVKPSPSRSAFREEMDELNSLLELFCLEVGGTYIDVATPMLDATGQPFPQLFQPDRLHLNAAGYRLWKKTLIPSISNWLSIRNANLQLSFVHSDPGILELSWIGKAWLESATDLSNDWTSVHVDQNGFQRIEIVSEAAFYRLR